MTTRRALKSREEEDYIAAYGRRLRVLRLWNGLSEAEMAAALGISVRSLKGREAGKLGGRGMIWLSLSVVETFGVGLDWLIGTEISGACRDEAWPLAPDGKRLPGILKAVP